MEQRRSYQLQVKERHSAGRATADSPLQSKKKIRAAHAKEKQQIQKRATTRIALTCLL
jgi:hypothetical protein